MLPIKLKWKRMYQCISLERSTLYLVLPQPCIRRILAEKIGSLPLLTYGSPFITLYSSHTNTWFHWNFLLSTQNSTGWLKGFPAANGKWMAIVFAGVCGCVSVCVCVLWPQHSHIAVTLSPAHQWGYTSRSPLSPAEPMMSPSVEWEALIEKRKQEVIVICCSAGKKRGDLIICDRVLTYF